MTPLRRLSIIALFSALVASAGLTLMPPLDRDEARFAQATAQMLESGDFITIRFQEAERNKKPAGIYWLQAASVAAFSSAEAREIWAYRLPSMAGAIIAALFTYLTGARLFDVKTGFLGALLLAAAPALAGEATIAKTDAMLLATLCAAMAAFAHIYAKAENNDKAGWRWPLLLWTALGAGILIKGPIAPMIIALTGLALFFRKTNRAWIAQLKPVSGIALLIAMIAPWAILIGLATEGRFFTEAVGGDMISKIGAGQEQHGGPPGYHLALVWLLLWPAAALIIPGLIHGYRERRLWPYYFLLAWIIPSWLVFELAATKLPHYTLPLYPALALLAAHAARQGATIAMPLIRKAGALIYLVIAAIAAALIIIAPDLYGAGAGPGHFAAAGALMLISGAAAYLFWRGASEKGAYAAIAASMFLALVLLNGVLPGLERLTLSPRLSAALEETGRHPLHNNAPPPALAGYHEPSAVFLIGTDAILTDAEGAAAHLAAQPNAAAIIEASLNAEFQSESRKHNLTLKALAVIDGVNYSKGHDVSLTLYTAVP